MQGDKFEQASLARLNGDHQTAITICRDLLAHDAANSDAMSLLGVSLAEIGNLKEARPFIEQSLELSPEHWRYLLNQSVLLECEGDLAGARKAAEKATRSGADRYETWGRLGDIAGKLEDYSQATQALTKALNIFPNHPALALLLAGAAYETGDYPLASQALDAFEKAAPGHPQAMRLRIHIARQKQDWRGLIEAAQSSLAASNNDEASRAALAFAYSQLGHFNKAAEVYRPLTEKEPPNAEHFSTFGKYLLAARNLESGIAYYKRAFEIDPQHSAAAAGISRYLNFTGDFKQAAEYARKAIAGDPNNADAFAELSLAVNSDLSENEIEQSRKIGADENQGTKHRAIAWFVCGDALHKRKDRQGAWEAWSAANELNYSIGLKDKTAHYEAAQQEAFVNRLISAFPYDAESKSPVQSQGPTPIFIVGMPRSGTTLLESALAAHPDVSSGGELPYMPYALSKFFEWADNNKWKNGPIPDDLIKTFRTEYLNTYREYNIPEAPFVTDKQPSNFLSVGLIRRVFPEARIIHIRRNPVETGFSIYRRNFTRGWPFSNSLAEIGHYYGQYARIMQHWSHTLKDNIAFVQYEDLVRNFESELRRLVKFCGFDWDPACLEYYNQDRTVITFSAAQVRKPPSPEHLDSTSPYDTYLSPLKEALKAANVDLQTGALK